MSHPAEKHFSRRNMPLAIVAACKHCQHTDTVKKGSKPGRGWGMREGNKQRGRMIQHIKSAHPDLLSDAPENASLYIPNPNLIANP